MGKDVSNRQTQRDFRMTDTTYFKVVKEKKHSNKNQYAPI